MLRQRSVVVSDASEWPPAGVVPEKGAFTNGQPRTPLFVVILDRSNVRRAMLSFCVILSERCASRRTPIFPGEYRESLGAERSGVPRLADSLGMTEGATTEGGKRRHRLARAYQRRAKFFSLKLGSQPNSWRALAIDTAPSSSATL